MPTTKSLTLTAAVATALATLSIGARADEQRPLTRDEVVAQVLAARQSGELLVLESGGSWNAGAKAAPLTREQVVADVMAARQSGELLVIESGGLVSHDVAAPVSREQVIADFMKARQAPPDALAMENSL